MSQDHSKVNNDKAYKVMQIFQYNHLMFLHLVLEILLLKHGAILPRILGTIFLQQIIIPRIGVLLKQQECLLLERVILIFYHSIAIEVKRELVVLKV